MTHKFLKKAGVKTEAEFYAKFPNDKDFFKAYPEMKMGGMISGKIKKYTFGTEDPIDPEDPLGFKAKTLQMDKEPQNLSWMNFPQSIYGNTPQAPATPNKDKVYEIDPLERQGVSDDIAKTKGSGPNMRNLEWGVTTGLTALNRIVGDIDSKKRENIDFERSIRMNAFNPSTTPYFYGNGSQAIMEYGGSLQNIPEMKKGGYINNNGRYVHKDGKTTSRPGLWSNVYMKNKKEFGGEVENNEVNSPQADILWGGKAEQVSSSTVSNPVVKFKGLNHAKGGIGIKYGQQLAEVEGNEYGWIDSQKKFHIFSPKKKAIGNKSFAGVIKDLAKQESVIDLNKSKNLHIINNTDPRNKYSGSAFETSRIMFKSQENQAKQIDMKKEELARYQSAILNIDNPQEAEFGAMLDGPCGSGLAWDEELQMCVPTAIRPGLGLGEPAVPQLGNVNFNAGLEGKNMTTNLKYTANPNFKNATTDLTVGFPNMFGKGKSLGLTATKSSEQINLELAAEMRRGFNANLGYNKNTTTGKQELSGSLKKTLKGGTKLSLGASYIPTFEYGGVIKAVKGAVLMPPRIKAMFDKVGADIEAALKAKYPGKTFKVVGSGDRAMQTQRGLKGSGASKTSASLHNFSGATDFAIYVDGKLQDGKSAESSAYYDEVAPVAKANNLSTLGSWDKGHVSLVAEGGKTPGGAFKGLLAKYPELIQDKNYIDNLSYLTDLVESGKADGQEINAWQQLSGKKATKSAAKVNYSKYAKEMKSPGANYSLMGENYFENTVPQTVPDRGIPDVKPFSVEPLSGNVGPEIPYDPNAPKKEATLMYEKPVITSDGLNMNNSNRKRGVQSPLDIRQITPELLTLATNQRDPVAGFSYQPELKQTFDMSYQLGRNENQSALNQATKIAAETGNMDSIYQIGAQGYKANETYNNAEVQNNAQQKLTVYGQNVDVLNDAKLKNIQLGDTQQDRMAEGIFNQRKELISAVGGWSDKSLKNDLENKTYNAYANLFPDYGFDSRGNVTYDRKTAVRWNSGADNAYLAANNKTVPSRQQNTTNSDGETTTRTTNDSFSDFDKVQKGIMNGDYTVEDGSMILDKLGNPLKNNLRPKR